MSWVYALEQSFGADGALLAGGVALLGVLVLVHGLRLRGWSRLGGAVATAAVLLAMVGVAMATMAPVHAPRPDVARRLILDPLLGASNGYGHMVWRPLVANVALFVPLGALTAARFPGRGWRVLGALIALSIAIEAIQYLAATGRIANMADVLANSAGAGVGIGLNRLTMTLVGRREPRRQPVQAPVLTGRRRP